ncbi:MAG TPA: hypothetical protein ENI95_01590 [Chloroflexi bacterium]|nr:hypothetical protein [Chloroflexota bacterium]
MGFVAKHLERLGLAFIVILLAVALLPAASTAAQTGGGQTIREGVWLAEYFGNPNLEGPVLYTEEIQGPWLLKEWPFGQGPREGGVPDDQFSARFTTRYTFSGGNVNFRLRSDDGSRMYINGVLIIDAWHDRAGTWFESRVLPIPAGTYTIVVEYYDAFGDNVIEAQFEETTDAPSAQDENFTLPGAPVPAVSGSGTTGVTTSAPLNGMVIDETSRYFTWSGAQSWGFGFYDGSYRNMYVWTDNEQFMRLMWGRWNPVFVEAGDYDVFVYIPQHPLATTNALYRVRSADGLSEPITVNQRASGASWVYLGTFTFAPGYGTQFLYLNDATYEPDGESFVLFDAASFVLRDN